MDLPVPPGARVARNPDNLGFAGNCNALAARATGEYLVFVNQDVQAIGPGWVEAMVKVFEDHPKVGIVGPRLVFPDGRVQSVGGIFDGRKGPWHRYLGWQNAFDARLMESEKVSWVTGACLMIRRADFVRLGGFRGHLYPGGYFEDVDLCLRVRKELEKEIWYCAEATLVHEVGSTGGSPNFMNNSRQFHRLWDEAIEPDTPFVYVNY